MSFFTDTITLYKHGIDPGTRKDKWTRFVIHKTQWVKKREKTVTAQGVINVADYLSVTIPCGSQPRGLWLPNPSSNKDIIVIGECTHEISDSYTLKDLRTDYETYTVRSVADNTNRTYLKHWSVIAT